MVGDPGKDLARLAEALPLREAYEDALQPAARELGRGLETVARTINAALIPLRAAIWGMDKIERWLIPSLAENLRGVPEDRIQVPSPLIAGPTIEALRFAASEETLREMYSKLLAAAMDAETARGAHPAFVDVLRQLTSDEARILGVLAAGLADRDAYPLVEIRAQRKDPEAGWSRSLTNFSTIARDAGCTAPDLCATYLENLARSGLIEMQDHTLVDKSGYEEIEQTEIVLRVVASLEAEDDRSPEIHRSAFAITNFGRQFLETCVLSVHPLP